MIIAHDSSSTTNAINTTNTVPLLPNWVLIPGVSTNYTGVISLGNGATDNSISILFSRIPLGTVIMITYRAKLSDFDLLSSRIYNPSNIMYYGASTSYAKSYGPISSSSYVDTPQLTFQGSQSSDINNSGVLAVGENVQLNVLLTVPSGSGNYVAIINLNTAPGIFAVSSISLDMVNNMMLI